MASFGDGKGRNERHDELRKGPSTFGGYHEKNSNPHVQVAVPKFQMLVQMASRSAGWILLQSRLGPQKSIVHVALGLGGDIGKISSSPKVDSATLLTA
jgi:hypothetical protein